MSKNPYGRIPQNDRKVRKEALKLSAPGRNRTRELLSDYVGHAGLAMQDFASRVGYSKASLCRFMEDRYEEVAGSSVHIEAAISKFIATHPIVPATQAFGELYETANVRALRETFQQLLRRPVAYMVYAPPGSQKSFVLEYLVAELNRTELAKNGDGRRAYYVYAHVRMRPFQLMKEVAMACGISSIGDRPRLARNLAYEFQGRRVLLVVDEAQHLSLDCFEALRVLLDRPPLFSLLFSGSHDLKAAFDRWSATLEQWNSRIIDKVRLPGVERSEAEGIVQREVGDLLRAMSPERASRKLRELVDLAVTQDAFEKDGKGRPRRYINIRTLTTALEHLKNLKAVSQLLVTSSTEAREAPHL